MLRAFRTLLFHGRKEQDVNIRRRVVLSMTSMLVCRIFLVVLRCCQHAF